MTCIIGFTDKENQVSWIGGDSLGSNSYTKSVQSISKVFKCASYPNVLMGGTGSFRHLDLLKYSEDLFSKTDYYEHTKIDHKYMVTKFIPQVITLFKNGVIGEDEKNRGGNFIVVLPGRVFEIQNDYSVLEPSLGFCAVGSGEEVAMGSLLTTKDYDWCVKDKIIKALECAKQYSCGVQRPFHIINTLGEQFTVV